MNSKEITVHFVTSGRDYEIQANDFPLGEAAEGYEFQIAGGLHYRIERVEQRKDNSVCIHAVCCEPRLIN